MEWDGDREGLEGVVWYGMVWEGGMEETMPSNRVTILARSARSLL